MLVDIGTLRKKLLLAHWHWFLLVLIAIVFAVLLYPGAFYMSLLALLVAGAFIVLIVLEYIGDIQGEEKETCLLKHGRYFAISKRVPFSSMNPKTYYIVFPFTTQILTLPVTVPTKEGRSFTGEVTIVWEVDFKNIIDYARERENFSTLALTYLDSWGRNHLAHEVYRGEVEPFVFKGFLVKQMTLTKLQDTGKRVSLPQDYADGIKRIIETAQTAADLERVKEALLLTASDSDKKFITIMCEDWRNEMRKGSIK